MRAHSIPPNASVDLRSETGRALAKEFPAAVSIWDPKSDVDFTNLFLDDGVHLTQAGHRILAQSLLEAQTPPSSGLTAQPSRISLRWT